jgi:hypothetical protein
MDSPNLVVWVKYMTGQAVTVSVPSGCDVSDLKKVMAQDGARAAERLFEIELYEPVAMYRCFKYYVVALLTVTFHICILSYFIVFCF